MAIETPAPVIVIGALNMDIYGMPGDGFRLRDSCPGRVMLGAGGVGHNIARHLAAQGVPVELVAALGCDDAAELLERRCAKESVGLRHVLRLPGTSSSYVCIHDAQGDMVAAINDMLLPERLRWEMLAPLLPVIDAAPLVVMDANLPEETIHWLARTAQAPLLLDPVSGFKAERVRAVIGRFAAVKPNALEAAVLSGEEEPARAAAWFLSQGVKQAFISLGEKGVYYADALSEGLLPATRMRAPNCTGAGDAMTAGIAMGMLRGASAVDCARIGIATVAGHLCAQGGVML